MKLTVGSPPGGWGTPSLPSPLPRVQRGWKKHPLVNRAPPVLTESEARIERLRIQFLEAEALLLSERKPCVIFK